MNAVEDEMVQAWAFMLRTGWTPAYIAGRIARYVAWEAGAR